MFMKKTLRLISKSASASNVWTLLKSPRAIAFIKLGVAAVGLVHAIDEFVSASPAKKPIGFHDNDHDVN